MPKSLAERVALVDEEIILADGLDAAFVGLGYRGGFQPVAVYDRVECIEVLKVAHEMTDDEAEEYFEYNVVGSYVGDRTPMFLEFLD